MKEDPHEQRDVKALHPEVCAQGAKLILDWQEEQMLKSPSPVDPCTRCSTRAGPTTPGATCKSTPSGWSRPAAPKAPKSCAGGIPTSHKQPRKAPRKPGFPFCRNVGRGLLAYVNLLFYLNRLTKKAIYGIM